MDIAALGLRVESGQVDNAQRSLDRLSGSARQAETASNRFGNQATGAARRAATANDNVAGSAARAATAYNTLGGAVRRVAGQFMAMAAATFGFRAITQTLGNFEASMAQVSAITRATTEELGAMRDIAKELGATTEFSASQAASGLRFLGMAGFSAAESIQAIPDVLDLATAASMDLGRAADITSNIMSAFGIAANDAARVSDVLAAASSRANTDVDQLGSAMRFVGPVASALSIEVNDVAAAIGALSDAGLQGSMAGTGLRRILSSLASPTSKAAGVIQSLGISLEELDPKANSIVDIVQRLRDANIEAADAFEIFGDRGAPAILALVENNDKLRELTGELSNVEGEANRMATTMRDNLQGDFRALASAAESLAIALGEAGITSALRAATQALTAFLRLLGEHAGGLMWAMGAIASVHIVRMVSGLAALARGMTAAAVAARALGVAMAFFGGPIGAAIVAISAAIAVLTSRHSAAEAAAETHRQAIDRLQTAIAQTNLANEAAVNSTRALIQADIEGARSAIAHANARLRLRAAAFEGAGGGAAGMFGAAEADRAGGPADIHREIRQNEQQLRNLGEMMRDFNRQVDTYVAPTIEEVADNVGRVTTNADSAGGALKKAAKTGGDAWEGLRSATRNVAEDITRFWQNMANNFVSTFQRSMEQGRGFLRSLGDATLSVLQDITQQLIRMATNRLITGLLGNLFGGSFLSPAVSRTIGSGTIAGIYHDGGIVGQPSAARMVSSSVFANAERMHNGGIAGLRANEVPAILERGERVIPRGANSNHANQNRAEPAVVRIQLDDRLKAEIVGEANQHTEVRIERFSQRELPGRMKQIEQHPRRVG